MLKNEFTSTKITRKEYKNYLRKVDAPLSKEVNLRGVGTLYATMYTATIGLAIYFASDLILSQGLVTRFIVAGIILLFAIVTCIPSIIRGVQEAIKSPRRKNIVLIDKGILYIYIPLSHCNIKVPMEEVTKIIYSKNYFVNIKFPLMKNKKISSSIPIHFTKKGFELFVADLTNKGYDDLLEAFESGIRTKHTENTNNKSHTN